MYFCAPLFVSLNGGYVLGSIVRKLESDDIVERILQCIYLKRIFFNFDELSGCKQDFIKHTKNRIL